MGGKMLQEVRQDLSDVVQVCEGKKKQTNYLRTLISDLVKGQFPSLFQLLFLLDSIQNQWCCVCRHPPPQLVSLHRSGVHDRDPVGRRLQ